MYRYETHLHTSPASLCAKAGVRESLAFYKSLCYDGVFITNHFLDGNLGMPKTEPFEKRIEFYFNDYYEALSLAPEIGIKVFLGVEISYKGTDFLIYGLTPDFYKSRPELLDMKKSDELSYLAGQGALIIQAHPFREASYIDHIRLYPRHVHGVEVINACRSELENEMARVYCEKYGLLPFAGSDNHWAEKRARLAGIETETPVLNEAEFITLFKEGKTRVFSFDRENAEGA